MTVQTVELRCDWPECASVVRGSAPVQHPHDTHAEERATREASKAAVVAGEIAGWKIRAHGERFRGDYCPLHNVGVAK